MADEKITFRIEGNPGEHNTFVQGTNFNRNLVANIIHYLDSKKFYKDQYNSSKMARALEGNDQHPVRKALRFDPDEKYCKVIDQFIKDLNE